MEVYFDDFKVEHVKSPVIQSNDYYPLGLTFNTFSRENSLNNQYLYNEMEKTDDKKEEKSDEGGVTAAGVAVVVVETGTGIGVADLAPPAAGAAAGWWLGKNIDNVSEKIADVLEWFGVAPETLRGPSQVDAHGPKKQSTGKLKGAKGDNHQRGQARDRQKETDKKRQKDDWHQNPNKKK